MEAALNPQAVYPALRTHIRRFFKGHRRYEYAYQHGPAGRVPSGFRVIRVAPSPCMQLEEARVNYAFEYRKSVV